MMKSAARVDVCVATIIDPVGGIVNFRESSPVRYNDGIEVGNAYKNSRGDILFDMGRHVHPGGVYLIQQGEHKAYKVSDGNLYYQDYSGENVVSTFHLDWADLGQPGVQTIGSIIKKEDSDKAVLRAAFDQVRGYDLIERVDLEPISGSESTRLNSMIEEGSILFIGQPEAREIIHHFRLPDTGEIFLIVENKADRENTVPRVFAGYRLDLLEELETQDVQHYGSHGQLRFIKTNKGILLRGSGDIPSKWFSGDEEIMDHAKALNDDLNYGTDFEVFNVAGVREQVGLSDYRLRGVPLWKDVPALTEQPEALPKP